MVKKIKFGPEIFYGNKPDAVPYVELLPLDDQIVASYTGPGSGLAYAEGYTENGIVLISLCVFDCHLNNNFVFSF